MNLKEPIHSFLNSLSFYTGASNKLRDILIRFDTVSKKNILLYIDAACMVSSYDVVALSLFPFSFFRRRHIWRPLR